MKNKNDKGLNTSLKLIVKASFLILAVSVLSKVFTYAYRIIVARQFGPEVYGLFTLALMVIGFITMIASLGLHEGLLRYVAYYRGRNAVSKIKYLFKKSLIFLIFSSLFFTILLFLFSDIIANSIFHNSQLTIYIRIFSLSLPFSILTGAFLAIFSAFERVGISSFINSSLQNLIRLLLLILFIFLGFSTNAVLFSYLLGSILVFIASYVTSKLLFSSIYSKYNLSKENKSKVTSEVFSYSWPVILAGGVYSLYSWTDSLVIGYYKDAISVGYYNAAFIFISLFGLAPELLRSLFFPLIVKEFSKNNLSLVRELSKQVSKWILIINLPLFLIMFLFPGVILNIAFGQQYTIANNVLRILSLGGFCSSIVMVLNSLLAMKGKTKVGLVNNVIFLSINLILNIIFIKIYGIDGVAFATMLSWILLNIVLFLEVRYYLNFIPLRKKMLKILVISLIPAAILFILKEFTPSTLFSIISLAVFYLLVYIILIFATGCLDSHDIEIIKAVKKRLISLNISKRSVKVIPKEEIV